MKASNKSIRVPVTIALAAVAGSVLASPHHMPQRKPEPQATKVKIVKPIPVISTPAASPSRPDNASNRQIRTATKRYSYHKRKATDRELTLAAQRAVGVQKEVDAESESAPKTRYVAVPTEVSDTVMLYDTKKEKVVGGSAYDMEKTPQKGEVVKFGFITAEYVGI